MDNPGTYSLSKVDSASDLSISTPGTVICDEVENLDGMLAATLALGFFYGAGGESVTVWIQTLFGSVWTDIACYQFGTASDHRRVNLSGLTATSIIQSEDGGFSSGMVQDGIFGSALRAKVTTTGTYSSTVLSLRVQAR